MAQHSDGNIKPEQVIIKDEHLDTQTVIKFLLSNGQEIKVTDNHGMLVYKDGDLYSATTRSQVVWAHEIEIGMMFRCVQKEDNEDDGTQNKDKIELVEVVDIKEETAEAVYNVAGYNFNVVAN